MLRIKEVNTKQEFLSLKNIWNGVLEQSHNKSVFLTFEWLYFWWECFENGKELMILLAEDDSGIVGIAPLMLTNQRTKRLFKIKTISFLGEGLSDYGDFIIIEGRSEVTGAFLDYININLKWDAMVLKQIREDSPNLVFIQNKLKSLNLIYEHQLLTRCSYIKVNNNWDEYYRTVSRWTRQDIKKKYNRIKRINQNYEVIIYMSDEINKLIDKLLNLNISRNLLKNKKSAFALEQNRDFVLRIIKSFVDKKICYLAIFKINSEIASYRLGFLYSRVFYDWSTAIDDKYENFSPGKLLLKEVIQDCFLNKKVKEFDFVRGEENYKSKWASESRINYELKVFNKKSLKAKIIKYISKLFKPKYDAAKKV